MNEIKKLSGDANGEAGYKDGDLGSAMFNKPKSFAIDKKNNIYIADKSNHVIRKISKSGIYRYFNMNKVIHKCPCLTFEHFLFLFVFKKVSVTC